MNQLPFEPPSARSGGQTHRTAHNVHVIPDDDFEEITQEQYQGFGGNSYSLHSQQPPITGVIKQGRSRPKAPLHSPYFISSSINSNSNVNNALQQPARRLVGESSPTGHNSIKAYSELSTRVSLTQYLDNTQNNRDSIQKHHKVPLRQPQSSLSTQFSHQPNTSPSHFLNQPHHHQHEQSNPQHADNHHHRYNNHRHHYQNQSNLHQYHQQHSYSQHQLHNQRPHRYQSITETYAQSEDNTATARYRTENLLPTQIRNLAKNAYIAGGQIPLDEPRKLAEYFFGNHIDDKDSLIWGTYDRAQLDAMHQQFDNDNRVLSSSRWIVNDLVERDGESAKYVLVLEVLEKKDRYDLMYEIPGCQALLNSKYHVDDSSKLYLSCKDVFLRQLNTQLTKVKKFFRKYGDLEVSVERQLGKSAEYSKSSKMNLTTEIVLQTRKAGCLQGIVMNEKTKISNGKIYIDLDLENALKAMEAEMLDSEKDDPGALADGEVSDHVLIISDNDDEEMDLQSDEQNSSERFFSHSQVTDIDADDYGEQGNCEIEVIKNNNAAKLKPRHRSKFIIGQKNQLPIDTQCDDDLRSQNGKKRKSSDSGTTSPTGSQPKITRQNDGKIHEIESSSENCCDSDDIEVEVISQEEPPRKKNSPTKIKHIGTQDMLERIKEHLEDRDLDGVTTPQPTSSQSSDLENASSSPRPATSTTTFRNTPELTLYNLEDSLHGGELFKLTDCEQSFYSDPGEISDDELDTCFVIIPGVKGVIDPSIPLLKNALISDINEKLKLCHAQPRRVLYDSIQGFVIMEMFSKKDVLTVLDQLHNMEYGPSHDHDALLLRVGVLEKQASELLVAGCNKAIGLAKEREIVSVD